MPHSSDSDIRGISEVAAFLYACKKQDWGLTWRSIKLTIQDTNFFIKTFSSHGKKKKERKSKILTF